MFYFNAEQLLTLGCTLAPVFRDAIPFPHVVVDSFLPGDIAKALMLEFPLPEHPGWRVWGPGPVRQEMSRMRDKLGMSEEMHFPNFTRAFMSQLCSATFLLFLQKLSGISGLLADPFFSGCGLHSTGSQGRLLIHADASRHPYGLPFHQILNVILYLNDDWRDEWGGHLELWHPRERRCAKRIAPVLNRLVVFETDSFSYHGHPHPLACPHDRRRNSIASYYYVIDRKVTAQYRGYHFRPHWIKEKPP
jgi:hypothetical protein